MVKSIDSSSSVPMVRDWWPLTRLIVVGLGLSAAACVLPGWQEPLTRLAALAGDMLRTALGLLFLFPVAAHFYLGFMVLPLVVVIMLNDWIYDAAADALRGLTRSPRGPGLRWSALGIELGVLIVLVELLRQTVSVL